MKTRPEDTATNHALKMCGAERKGDEVCDWRLVDSVSDLGGSECVGGDPVKGAGDEAGGRVIVDADAEYRIAVGDGGPKEEAGEFAVEVEFIVHDNGRKAWIGK